MNKLLRIALFAAIGAGAMLIPMSRLAAEELLFYSSVPRNMSDVLVKGFEAQNPDTTVKMFQAGTETLLEKIELEIEGRGKPDADVVWIQEQAAMERLAERHLLMRYQPAGADQIADGYKARDGTWVATFVTHVVLMYSTRALNAETAPKAWQDLLQPRFKNKLTFANPRVSGTGSAVISALVQNFGWPYVEKLAANHLQIANGHPPMVSTIITGERTAGPMLDYSVFEPMAKGQPIGFTFPREGVIAVPAFAAIVAGTKVPQAAQRFVDFFASREAGELLRARGLYHTRADVAPPDGWPAITAIKLLPFDWQRHKAEKEAIKDRFADLTER